ncbi:hypothetical protein LZ30DRAFT_42895 [Colletotrichum cereale]|nr:hypothetical protein LZ30DRAFT_42895 [Colletotrichum cereale]
MGLLGLCFCILFYRSTRELLSAGRRALSKVYVWWFEGEKKVRRERRVEAELEWKKKEGTFLIFIRLGRNGEFSSQAETPRAPPAVPHFLSGHGFPPLPPPPPSPPVLGVLCCSVRNARLGVGFLDGASSFLVGSMGWVSPTNCFFSLAPTVDFLAPFCWPPACRQTPGGQNQDRDRNREHAGLQRIAWWTDRASGPWWRRTSIRRGNGRRGTGDETRLMCAARFANRCLSAPAPSPTRGRWKESFGHAKLVFEETMLPSQSKPRGDCCRLGSR